MGNRGLRAHHDSSRQVGGGAGLRRTRHRSHDLDRAYAFRAARTRAGVIGIVPMRFPVASVSALATAAATGEVGGLAGPARPQLSRSSRTTVRSGGLVPEGRKALPVPIRACRWCDRESRRSELAVHAVPSIGTVSTIVDCCATKHSRSGRSSPACRPRDRAVSVLGPRPARQTGCRGRWTSVQCST